MTISRRIFIRRMGLTSGAVLLTPIVDGLIRDAFGQVPKAKRLVWYGSPHGIATRHLDASVLEPFAAVKGKLNVYRSLSCTTYRFKHGTSWAFMTGRRPLIGGAPAPDTNKAGAFGDPGGPTLDYVLAQELGGGTPVRLMNLGSGGTASGPNQRVGSISSATEAFQRHFKDLVIGAGLGKPASPTSEQLMRKSFLDFMAKDVARVKSRLAGPEKPKFDQYIGSLEGLQASLQASIEAPAASSACKKPDAPSGGKILQNYRDLATIVSHAIACGLTRHVSIGFPGSNDIALPELGFPSNQHNVNHTAAGETVNAASMPVPDAIKAVKNLHRFNAEQVVKIYRLLGQFSEGNGTMADNTVIAWTSNCGSHHNGNFDFALVTLGDAGGAIGPTERDAAVKGNVHQYWLAIAKALGSTMTKWGEASSPLPGMLA
jgi:hypothetical protein